LIAVFILALLPYVFPNARKEELGHWFPRGNRIAQILGCLIVALIFTLTIIGWIN